jgi:hypothetical protein
LQTTAFLPMKKRLDCGLDVSREFR